MRYSKRHFCGVLLPLLCVFALGACAEHPKRSNPDQQGGNYLPFSIRFTPQGELVILDEKGNRVPAKEARFPISAKAIEKIEALTYVQYRGSHVGLIVRGGKMYVIPLPHN